MAQPGRDLAPEPTEAIRVTDPTFRDLDIDAYFTRRLKDHGLTIWVGTTDQGIRKGRIRAAIIGHALERATIGKRADGTRESYAEAFERLYGELLHAKQEDAA